jgi:sugar lactone lactonase YvrE
MIPIKKRCILFAAGIVMSAIGCKKSDPAPLLPKEKKTVVTTIAGDGSAAFANGPVMSAKFDRPVDVAIAPDGTIYVTDYSDHRVRKIAAGEVTTLAGNDTFGFKNGNGGTAQFYDPFRIVTDAAGNCYLIDQVDARIRKITPAGEVTTYAGMEQTGFLNGPALTARFLTSMGGIACDGTGNLYVGDTFNGRIRKISMSGEVSTAAGSGIRGFMNGDPATAQFWFPAGVACDPQGNVYIADRGNFCIRKLTAGGVITTLAGTGIAGRTDGDTTVAQFYSLSDIAADSQGNLYVIDEHRIRKVTPQGVVSSIAGSTAGYADGDSATAKFSDPEGLGTDAQGNVYVADAGNNRIRKISFQ